MNAQQTAQAQEIFGQAIELGADARRAFVEYACGNDTELRQEVQALLTAIDQAGSFLSAPTAEGEQTIANTTMPFSSMGEQPGTRIGRYKLLQLIGEGGFGLVYMAEQEHPVRRKVALKIIKLGMDTKQVIARFEAERQAVAMMDHPNIAHVFDAGITDTGRPYFVMELVRGVPITAYCDENNLPTSARLHLFTQVCQAVQHAHQKGIIHRDLKPTNVLVTMHDDKAVPKIIDFGISKALNQRLTERTLFTEYRQFIGTPQYMSPEQAQLSGIDADTRSDVYSLGVLLYELLTGTTPFTPKELHDAAYEQIRQIIREVEPPKPSTRLSTLGQSLTSVAARRGTDGRRLAQLMRGELDWIVMKCLEKDRTRRYETASALAADVRRHLADEPVQARPSSFSYRLLKLVRRHRAAVLAISVSSICLIGGLAGAAYGLVRATHERDLAITARLDESEQRKAAELATATARVSAAKAEAINRFLQGVLASARPDQTMGKPVLVRDIVDRAAEKIDKGDFKDQPEVEASVRQTLGRSYWSLGQYSAAEAQLRKALALSQRSTGKHSELDASILGDLADAVGWSGDRPGAVVLARQALALQESLNPEPCLRVAAAMENLAMDLSHINGNAEAESLARRAMAIRHKLGERESAGLAFDLILVGEVMQGDPAMKEELLRRGLAMQKKLMGAEHPDVAHTLHNLGAVLLGEGKLAEAKSVLYQSLAIKRKVLGPDHPDMESGLLLLWHVLVELKDWKDLEPVLLEHYAWMTKNRPNDPPIEDLQNLVRIDGVLGRPAAAKPWQQRLRVAVSQKLSNLTQQINEKPEDPKPLEERAWWEGRFGHFEQSADDYARAIELDPQNEINWYFRGCLLAYLKQDDQYRALCEAMIQRFSNSDDPSVLDRTAETCLLLPDGLQSRDEGDPLDLANRAIQKAGDDPDRRAWFHLYKGMAFYRHCDFEAAIQALEDSLTPTNIPRHSMAQMYLAMAYHRLGKEDLAKTALSTGTREMDLNFPRADDGDLGGDGLENWLMCQVARSEAKTTIGSAQPATRPTGVH